MLLGIFWLHGVRPLCTVSCLLILVHVLLPTSCFCMWHDVVEFVLIGCLVRFSGPVVCVSMLLRVPLQVW